MTTQTHQPWKPTCWVGGMFIGDSFKKPWMDIVDIEIAELNDDSRKKYAAKKATAAILRSMRK